MLAAILAGGALLFAGASFVFEAVALELVRLAVIFLAIAFLITMAPRVPGRG